MVSIYSCRGRVYRTNEFFFIKFNSWLIYIFRFSLKNDGTYPLLVFFSLWTTVSVILLNIVRKAVRRRWQRRLLFAFREFNWFVLHKKIAMIFLSICCRVLGTKAKRMLCATLKQTHIIEMTFKRIDRWNERRKCLEEKEWKMNFLVLSELMFVFYASTFHTTHQCGDLLSTTALRELYCQRAFKFWMKLYRLYLEG